jgi:hypothetical protein
MNAQRIRRDTKPLPKNKIFPFMSLPGELRNQIYEECLKDCNINKYGEYEDCLWLHAKQWRYQQIVQRVNLTPEFWKEDSNWNRHILCCNAKGATIFETGLADGNKSLVPNILAVSKQIYQEAMPILYGQRMVFADVTALAAFAARISHNTASLLRHIEIRCWNRTVSRRNMPFTAMCLLAAKGATNIKNLNINCLVGSLWFGQFYHPAHITRTRVRPETDIPKGYARRVYRACYPLLEAIGKEKPDGLDQCDWYRGLDVIQFGDRFFQDWFDYRNNVMKSQTDKPRCNADLVARKELRKLMKTWA